MELRASAVPPLGSDASGVGALGTAPSSPVAPLTFTRAMALLDTIPGVDQRGAERGVAETGIDMARFGPASRLAV
jgi:hypothetical protein